MEENKIYAPVIIPTLCRYEHFRRCIESLQRNSYAKYTELYIGLDYPLKPSHEEGYRKISDYLDGGIMGFKKVHVIRHSHNTGAVGNSEALREKVYVSHDRYIFSEDDNEFSANFLEYMNKCFWKYTDDESVFAISGFNYPMEIADVMGNVYFNHAFFSAFGYGIWKSRDKYIEQACRMELFEERYRDYVFMRQLRKSAPRQYCNFVKGMLQYTEDLIQNEQLRCEDLCKGLFMCMQDKKMVFPIDSKVKNWGYDGTGVNCKSQKYQADKKISYLNFGTDCQKLDDSIEFLDVNEVNDVTQTALNRKVNVFFRVKTIEMIRTDVAYILSQMFGFVTVRKWIKKIT